MCDERFPAWVLIQQVYQLLAAGEAALAGDLEVLLKRIPEPPTQKSLACSGVTGNAISPWTACERTWSYWRSVSSGWRKYPVTIRLSVICRRARGAFFRPPDASPSSAS